MRYVIMLLLLCAVPLTAPAQDSTITKPDDRMMFRSKVRQLTSYLNEGNTSSAAILFNDVAGEMEAFIAKTQSEIDTASGSRKKVLKEKLDNQRQLAAQFHSFKADLVRNRSSIDTWTDQFIKTLY